MGYSKEKGITFRLIEIIESICRSTHSLKRRTEGTNKIGTTRQVRVAATFLFDLICFWMMLKLGLGLHLTQYGVAAIFSDVQVLLAESEDEFGKLTVQFKYDYSGL
jgi:hypothetical protein